MRVTQVSESTFTVKGHGVHTAFYELTEALKKQPNIRIRVNRFEAADIIHIHTVGIFSMLFLLFAPGKKVVSAHVVPDSLVGSLVGAKFWLPLATRYLRWFYNRADLVVSVSDSTKRDLEAMKVRARIEVVYNLINTGRYEATDADRASARKKLGYSADQWLVVGSGQVQPRKRIDSFVAVARQLPHIQFVWVGGMPFGKLAAENGTMKRIIEDAPPNVLFTGVVELEQVRQYYWASNVFWLPSSQETFGLVVVEAAASGLPVVLRDIPDYAETFGDCAVLATDETFAEAILQLREDQSYYAHAVTRSAEISERFGVERGVERMLEAYRSLLV